MGLGHSLGFDKIPECRVLAIADSDKNRLKTSQKWFIRNSPQFFNDYEEILKLPDVHAVVITTPSYLHEKMTIDTLNANKDVFLEKPIAPTIEATDRIIKAVAKTDRILQVGLTYRYSNLFRTTAQLIEKGTFGNVMMAYCKEYRDNFPSQWFFDESKSGGALLDKNCHHFDLFNWFIRSPPKSVYAMGGQHVVKPGHKIQCLYSRFKGEILEDPQIVDHANVLVEYENGAKGNLGLCMYEIEPIEGFEIGFMGDNGAWALAKKEESLVIAGGPVGKEKEIFIDNYSDNEGLVHVGCQTQRREFLKCLEMKTQPYANLLIARESCVISLAAEKSIKEGRLVLISEFDNPEINTAFERLKYRNHPRTPPIFSLEGPELALKLKRKLRIKKRKLKIELKRIKEQINNI